MSETKILVSSKVMDDMLIEQKKTNVWMEKLVTIESKRMVMEKQERRKGFILTMITICFTVLMATIAVLAFWLEVVKIEDMAILKERAGVAIDTFNPWSDPNDKIN